MGRPSSFSEEIADTICERMIEGEDLVEICSDPAMPGRSTVYRWMDDFPEFGTRCARAREGLAEYAEHRALKEAMQASSEEAAIARVRVSALQWRASKLAPKKYGDRVTQEHTGPDGGAIKTEATVIVLPANGREVAG